MNAPDDDPFPIGDEFNGDDEFREQIVSQRTETETRDVVAELDADWFAEHPRYRTRLRRYIPGEFDSPSGGFCGGDPGEFAVLVRRGGVKVLFPLGDFDARGWQAGGLE